MGKRLTTQTRLKRLRADYSRKELARMFGVSVSSIGRAERGQTSGSTIAAPVRELFGLGKRARANVASGAVPLPSAKPARTPKAKAQAVEIVSPLRRAEGKISQFDGDTMVVVQVTMKGTGKSRTLYARGGIEVSAIRDNLERAIESQVESQYRGGIDWDDVIDIDVQEY